MTCKGCRDRKLRLQKWLRDILGITDINQELRHNLHKTNRDLCTNFSHLESRVVVLQRQLKAATQTLQRDYVIIGEAVDTLHNKVYDLEFPGAEVPHVGEPHKAH